MVRHFLRLAAAAMLATSWPGLAAHAQAADQEDAIVLSRAAAIDYALYQRAENPGFLALSLDGTTSAHVAHDGAWTDEATLAPLAREAIAACEAEANGVPCLIFARNGKIVLAVPYTIPHD